MQIQRDIFRKMLAVIVSLLLPMLLLLFYSNQTGIAVVEKEIKASSVHKLSFLLSQLDAQIYQLNANMLTLVRDVEAQKYATRFTEDPYDRSRLRAELENKLLLLSITSPWTNRIALYAPMLDIVVSSDGKSGFDKSEREEDKPTSWSFKGEPAQPSTWAFVRRMTDSRPKTGDIRNASLAVETTFSGLSLRSMLDQYKAGSSGNPFIWLPEEEIVIGNRHSLPEQAREVAEKLEAVFPDRSGSVVQTLTDGGKVLSTFLYSEALQGYLIDYVPLNESLAPIARQRGLFYLVSALMLVTAALSALLLYRHVRVPIRRLVEGVQHIRLGHYGARIHDRASSEFTFLYNRFNQMAEQIQELIERVYEERIRTKDARVKQLQSQINPHFLYNCFSHIIHMAEMGNAEGVAAMSHNLSDYYRYTTRADKPDATLAEELALVVNYLEIQKIRLPRLDYRIDVPERARSLPFPRLLLQPLVENAVVHGIEPFSRPGFVSVSGEIRPGELALYIADTGPGMSGEELRSLASDLDGPRSEDSGYGMYNVHQRLQLVYGAAAGLSFDRLPEGGFRIEMRIPYSGETEERPNDPCDDR
ncbi:sensor histidine kinase [Cohnella sp.]|uniref:sensor histidine kinase n=1 Tax=Cohnella sp. TaxID=1883426 RepID=UPI0037044563